MTYRRTIVQLRHVATVAALLAISCLAAAIQAAPADAAGWWQINSDQAPTNIQGGGEGIVTVHFANLGDLPIDGTASTVTASVHLPTGLSASSISGGGIRGASGILCSPATLQCTVKAVVNPYEQFRVEVHVKSQAAPGTEALLSAEASVEGGAVPPATASVPVKVSPSSQPFGVASYELSTLSESGAPSTQAGSHPFQLTSTFALDQQAGQQPVALPRDLSFVLPPGLVGNPNATAQCSMTDFFALVDETNLCPPGSVVGVATVTANEPKVFHVFTATVPVFNLVPSQGEPARFGLEVIGKVPVVIDTSVRTGRDYGVVATTPETTQTAGLLSAQVTFWGVPGDPRHDAARGWECVAGGYFHEQIGKACPVGFHSDEQPLLTLPTSCAHNPEAEPVVSSMVSDSWLEPSAKATQEYLWRSSTGQPLGYTGCDQLDFSPSLAVVPEQHTASTPTGLSVDLKVPQSGIVEPEGLAEAAVRDTTVTLPPGVELSPSAANGLVGCSEAEAGFEGFDPLSHTQQFSPAQATCPDASKVGTVHIRTPLLSHELEGGVYVADPAPDGEPGRNPFNSLLSLYLVAKDPVSGVLVKLAGEGELDESSLRIKTTFRDAPQVPFEELKLDLFGGPRASVSTPDRCGAYGTEATLVPWSGTGPVSAPGPAEDFLVSTGPAGASCPTGALPFSPGFMTYSTNEQAGAYTGFTLELGRPDGDQALRAVSMHLPPGIAAMLSSVELCSAAAAASSSCPASSEVGHATAFAGLGPEPFVQEGGRVFITGPYGGAPFGLEIVTPAKAGPFDLGFITVRSKLFIDPNDASVTIVSDPLPTQLRGIPLQLKRVRVTVDRPNFQFNPTSCDAMSVSGVLSGAEGASAPVSSAFQVGGCAALPFAPKLTAAADGHASRTNGVTFRVTVKSGGFGQSNIRKVDLQLPVQLPSRLTTLQKACPEATFNANPATCSPESAIGTAKIATPVLRNPLTGPAYLVSHGGAGFPDVEFVLQGEGVTIVLDGQTDIKHGITYSRFESAPDAPFTTFETVLPAGPHSALSAYTPATPYDLCGLKLTIPTRIVSQSQRVIEQSTPVSLLGCGGVASARTQKLSLSQRFKKAMKACKRRYGRNAAKRHRCERNVRRMYAAKALAACRHGRSRSSAKTKACEVSVRRRYRVSARASRKVG